jgi:hypothetical protein
MLIVNTLDMSRERLHELFGQHRHPVFSTLSIANDDSSLFDLRILDPKAATFEQS